MLPDVQLPRLRILVVEDEAITAMVLKKRLKMAGYEVVDAVTSGEAAILSARQHLPDLILMDILLAGVLDGVAAAAAILAEKPTPLIFVTGYEDSEIQNRARKLNPQGYLLKPYHFELLEAIISTVERR